MGTFHEELPLINWSLNHVVLWGHVTLNTLFSIWYRPMVTKYGEVVTHDEGLLPINSYNLLNMCPRGHKASLKYISTITMFLVAIVQGGAILQGPPPKNLHDFSVRLSCEVTWQFKYVFICRRLMDSKLDQVLTCSNRRPSLKLLTLWSPTSLSPASYSLAKWFAK